MLKRPQSVEWFVLLVALALYFALAAWMTAHWTPLGDEPHYLLAAHSLVVDRDLDLANNYAQQDFKAYLEGETLDPHVKVLPDGAQILNHDLGLPFVIALPYALAGRAGVEFLLAFCGALLVWQTWKLAFAVSHSALWSTVGAFGLGFTPPLVLYATLVYPEVLGALIFVWATRTILFRPASDLSRWQLAILALGIAALPWLSVRFVILLTLLVLFVAVCWSNARRQGLVLFSVVGVGFLAYLVINNLVLAGVVPRGNPTELASGNLATLSVISFTRGVIGWWIDPQRGTLIMAPVYVLALAGVPRLLRWNRAVGLVLVSPLVVLIPLVAVLGGFWIPFEVGARYFVVALPLLAAPLALALQAGFAARVPWQRLAFGGLTALLVGLSAWHSTLMVGDASYAYGSVVMAYSRLVGSDVSPLFASMGRALIVAPSRASLNVAVEEREGELFWHAQAGDAGTIVQSFDLTELTVGHYEVEFRARARGAAADAELLELDVYSSEGLPLLHSTWQTGALDNASLQRVAVEFDNPYFDRWGFPLTLEVATTGAADLTLSVIRFDPDNATTWLRAAVWLSLVLAIVVLLNLDLLNSRRSRPTADGQPPA